MLVLGFLAGLLATGSIGFWLLLLVSVIALTLFVENEAGAWATFTLVLTVVILNWACKLPIFQTVAAHPMQALMWVWGYFGAGVAWGLFKWYVYAHKMLGRYKAARDQFLKASSVTLLTPALALKLKEHLEQTYKYQYRTTGKVRATPPLASEHRGDIIRWMTYWPFSIIGTLLNDFVRRAWNAIYNFMAETYDAAAAHVFRKYAADMELANQGALEEAAKQQGTMHDTLK